MKAKIICAIVISISILFGVAACGWAEQYPNTMMVDWVNYELDRGTLIDSNGWLWDFNGAEDWQTGDIVALIMDDCGTEIIFDDEIIMMRYVGTIDDF